MRKLPAVLPPVTSSSLARPTAAISRIIFASPRSNKRYRICTKYLPKVVQPAVDTRHRSDYGELRKGVAVPPCLVVARSRPCVAGSSSTDIHNRCRPEPQEEPKGQIGRRRREKSRCGPRGYEGY